MRSRPADFCRIREPPRGFTLPLPLDRKMPPTTARLGPLAAMSLVAGSRLGIGIFIAPPAVAQHVDRPGAFLFLWVLGGVSALCGALSLAELGAMMPRAGGDYPYQRRAYGPGLGTRSPLVLN